jgi:hypothetical protein
MPKATIATVDQLVDEFIVWDKGVNMETFELVRVAIKAWGISPERANEFIDALYARNVI